MRNKNYFVTILATFILSALVIIMGSQASAVAARPLLGFTDTPTSTTPAVTTPAGTTPAVTTPAVTTPVGTTPVATTPPERTRVFTDTPTATPPACCLPVTGGANSVSRNAGEVDLILIALALIAIVVTARVARSAK